MRRCRAIVGRRLYPGRRGRLCTPRRSSRASRRRRSPVRQWPWSRPPRKCTTCARIGFGRRGMFEQPAEVDEMFLRHRACSSMGRHLATKAWSEGCWHSGHDTLIMVWSQAQWKRSDSSAPAKTTYSREIASVRTPRHPAMSMRSFPAARYSSASTMTRSSAASVTSADLSGFKCTPNACSGAPASESNR